ncbi:MAG: PHP domain-containing protein [Gemmatimonadota bacterium]|nr:MAG: PHP domain-containing protein [Gemmatimonadota bacterium]
MNTLRLDLHIHTRASHDCLSDYRDVVSTARARGLDRIAVTDHNEIEGAFRVRDLAPDLVIVGEEMKTAEGVDVTGLFISEKIPKGTPAVETAQAIREQGGLVYVPHPFAGGKGLGEAVLAAIESYVDVIEIFNARIHKPALNERARRWAERRDLPGGAGSDAHTLREIGRGVIEVPEYEGKAGFLEALRAGRVVGRYSSYLVHLASTWAKLIRRQSASSPSFSSPSKGSLDGDGDDDDE